MSITAEYVDQVLVLSVSGQVNSANASQVEAGLLSADIGDLAACVLDLSGVEYLSSAGLRAVLMLARKMHACGGRLVVCGLQPHVHEVFEVSGFAGILRLVGNRRQALAELAA